MTTFAATIAIQAAPERIWSILTDATRYPEGYPTVTKVDGRIAPGERIALHVTLNPGRAFPVIVESYDPPRRMVWRGMPLRLFVGERTFALVPTSPGVVEFSMRESFSGLLAHRQDVARHAAGLR